MASILTKYAFMMGLGLALISLSACEQFFPNDQVTPTGSRGTPTAPSEDGTQTSMVPPNVLSIPGIPIPDGVMVSMNETVISGDDARWTGQVVMNSEDYQPIQLVEFMRQNMPSYGWVQTAIVRSRRTSITYLQENRYATVRIQPTGSGTEIDIVIAEAGQQQSRRIMSGGGSPSSSPIQPIIQDQGMK